MQLIASTKRLKPEGIGTKFSYGIWTSLGVLYKLSERLRQRERRKDILAASWKEFTISRIRFTTKILTRKGKKKNIGGGQYTCFVGLEFIRIKHSRALEGLESYLAVFTMRSRSIIYDEDQHHHSQSVSLAKSIKECNKGRNLSDVGLSSVG